VYFKFEPLENSFADLTVNQNDMVATVTLNSQLSEKSEPFKDVKRSAKHEALHLLLSRLEHRVHSKYVANEEIYEELVFKLEELIM